MHRWPIKFAFWSVSTLGLKRLGLTAPHQSDMNGWLDHYIRAHHSMQEDPEARFITWISRPANEES